MGPGQVLAACVSRGQVFDGEVVERQEMEASSGQWTKVGSGEGVRVAQSLSRCGKGSHTARSGILAPFLTGVAGLVRYAR